MMEASVDPYDLGLHDLLYYLERLVELVDSLKKQVQQENPNAQQNQEVKILQHIRDQSNAGQKKASAVSNLL
jgi:hypothetical protein